MPNKYRNEEQKQRQTHQAVLILVSGKRYAGKDTFAVLLTEACRQRHMRVVIRKTADRLKKEFCRLYALDSDRFLSEREYKEKYREAFAEFTSGFRREENAKKFLASIASDLREQDVIIVSDVRTKYDLFALRKRSSTTLTVRINASEQTRMKRGLIPSHYDTLSFETELDEEKFDYTIENDGSVAALEEMATSLCFQINLREESR